MYIFLLLILTQNNDKTIEVRYIETAPRIDGIIEQVWQQADSAYDFVQNWPYEDREPTEKTIVYVLQDKNNLYFAFKCLAEQNRPVKSFTRDEDYVTIGIDPFGSKTTAYYFRVFASGIKYDGWILDDGRSYDDSWEGVWSRGVKVYEDYFVVEVKIPFKSIRYKKGLDAWGIQFERHCAANTEDDYWTRVSQVEGVMVSKWCPLTGVNPQATGYYFEIYPEAYFRYDKNWYAEQESIGYKPSISMNVKWDITSQTTINATAYPDFAQIESDPFSLNLGRYPTYLDERRPFFLEGKDVFRMSDFGSGKGFFRPLDIFYSRRIGKSMNGDAVPIIAGLKLTNKSEDWNIGLLGAYTNEYEKDDSLLEPYTSYGVLRVKRGVMGNSDIGILFSGTMNKKDDYNYAIGLDGVYRKGINQFIAQGAFSDKNGKMGWAFESGFFGLIGNFLTIASGEVVHDSFDVSDIGFVPWVGQKKLLLISGPFKQYAEGFVSNIFAAPGVIVTQEPGEERISTVGLIEINPNTRNGWGCDLSFYLGPYYEADTNYLYKSVNLSTWGRFLGQHINFGCTYSYTYNYWRGFLAYQGSNWLSYNYSIMSQMSIGLSSNIWIEWDTLNAVIGMTPRFRPNVSFRLNADMKVSAFSEFVLQTPHADIGETTFSSARTGMLFSWNFLPKSWLYIALNDFRKQDEVGDVQALYQVGAVKVKYLIYF
jgi:hypothetical protein